MERYRARLRRADEATKSVARRGEGQRHEEKVFISFHAPAFCTAGMGPIPEAQNPHKTIATLYAKGPRHHVVFNGHVHTTQLFEVDGVKYLVLHRRRRRGTGPHPARQRSTSRCPTAYPVDQYWKGANPTEEYNYVLVDVQPGKATKFTLNRFRPGTAEPFATVELFK